MDVGSARAQLTFMLAADTAPVISGAGIDLLLTQAQRQDKYGRYPSDPTWIATWDLHSAACEGWRWKAAQLASEVSITTDGTTVNRATAFIHAQKMITEHRRRITPQSIRVQGETADLYDRAAAIYDLSVLGN